jgi:hypothetical protein
MGCHLGWHFAEGCPLRGGRGVFIKKTPKTIKEKKINLICMKLLLFSKVSPLPYEKLVKNKKTITKYYTTNITNNNDTIGKKKERISNKQQ